MQSPPPHFFLDRELLFIELKVGTDAEKTFEKIMTSQKIKKLFEHRVIFFLISSYKSIFCRKLSFHLSLLDCKLDFFFAFWLFASFFNENFCLNTYYGNILFHFGVAGVKIYYTINYKCHTK